MGGAENKFRTITTGCIYDLKTSENYAILGMKDIFMVKKF